MNINNINQKKFLINLRKEIDILLRSYGYGGELSAGVQAYEIPWAGGGRPTMFAKGGEVRALKALMNDPKLSSAKKRILKKQIELIENSKGGNLPKDLAHLIYVSNINNPNPNRELVAMVKGKGDAMIIKSALQQNVGVAPLEYTMESKFANGGVTASSDIIDIAIYWLDENEPLQGENYSINSRELSKKLKSGKRDKQTIAELMDMLYSNGQNDDTAIELDGYSVAVYGEEGVDDYIRGEDIYYAIDEEQFAKGGKTWVQDVTEIEFKD